MFLLWRVLFSCRQVACVLLFGLGRTDFPVDTHVWKIALSLGWLPAKAGREEAYAHLNSRVPAAMKYELHVLLVEHGKQFKNDVAALRAGMLRAERGAAEECS